MSTRKNADDERAPTEQSPLLPRPAHDRNDRTGEPAKAQETLILWAQFSLILFFSASRAIDFTIFLFIPQLIREIGITNGDETRVGFYVGLMVCRWPFMKLPVCYQVAPAKVLLRHAGP